MGRVILAGVVAGFAMYVVMSILHMSPIAQIGIRTLKSDDAAIAAIKDATGDKPGLYFFPKVDMKSKDAMAKSEAALKSNPSGIIVYRRAGWPGMAPRMLIGEFVVELIQSLIAAGLLSVTVIAGYWGRVGFVGAVGLVSAITTNASYHIWYAYPHNYTLANMGIEIVSFLAAGLVLAAMLKPKTA